MRFRPLRLALAALALVPAVACLPPQREARTRIPPREAGVCEELAYVFFLVAQGRDRGYSRRDQLRSMSKSVNNPFAKRPEATLGQLVKVVDFVYAQPGDSPEEIEGRVLDRCSVDAGGHAVVRSQPVQ